MSKRVKVAIALAAVSAAVGAALSMSACEGVPLTAAPGTSMTLSVNPGFVPANGGVSVVTAILVEPAGTFVPDGTEIFCYTNLGRVDPSGKSVDGFVRVNFVSDARSGTATVCCVSGGPAPVPSGSPSPTPTPTPTPATGAAGVAARSTTVTPVFGASDVAADENQACTTITVGSALPSRVQVTATPSVLSTARSATIVANVFDGSGNPVQNVPVIFTITAVTDGPNQEFLASGGSPRFTDANGQAFDTLTTEAPVPTKVAVQKTVTITATAANGESGTTTVSIDYPTAG